MVKVVLRIILCLYQDNNTYALKSILELLDKKMKQADVSVKENLMPVLSALYKLAWEDRIIRKYLRSEIFPPLGHVGHSRPEEGNGMRNQLIQLMTAPLGEVKVWKPVDVLKDPCTVEAWGSYCFITPFG